VEGIVVGRIGIQTTRCVGERTTVCPITETPEIARKREQTMWNLLVFAIIGLLVGAASRLLYPGRRSTHILGTMLIGMIGAVVGGMISWS
jgi:hypothetical protein